MTAVLLESTLPNRTYRGKVRDTYDLGDKMLIIATDRISAADVVLPAGIPEKGRILTQLSAWWFERMKEVVPNHFIAVITEANTDVVPFPLGPEYYGRSMLVRTRGPSRRPVSAAAEETEEISDIGRPFDE